MESISHIDVNFSFKVPIRLVGYLYIIYIYIYILRSKTRTHSCTRSKMLYTKKRDRDDGHGTSPKREIKRQGNAALSIAMVSLAVCGIDNIL